MSGSKAVTYSPYDKTFYVGSLESDVDFSRSQNYEPIAVLNPKKELGDGRLDFVNHELVRQAERDHRAGVIDAPSISSVTIVDLLQEVLGRQWQGFYAREACTTIAVPKLQLKVPIYSKLSASTKVPELVEATLKEGTFTTTSFNLWKNVVHIMASDEATLKGTIEPLSFNIGQAAGALAKAANTQIVSAIEGLTTASGSNWSTMTTNADFSANNPLTDITNNFVTITNNNYRPTTICMHPKVMSNYQSNTFINGYAQATDRNLLGVVSLDKFPGIKAVVDPAFTSTVATLFDQSTMLLGEVPTVAEQYRNPQAGANAYIIRQWMQPLATTNNAGRKITSVS